MAALSSRERGAIVQLAARFKLPAIYADRLFVTSGGLISYGPDLKEQYRLAAGLRGSHPQGREARRPAGADAGEIQHVAINLKTAKALGLTVSPGLRELADEVVD